METEPTVGVVEGEGDACVLSLHADDLDWVARWLLHRDLDFAVLDLRSSPSVYGPSVAG